MHMEQVQINYVHYAKDLEGVVLGVLVTDRVGRDMKRVAFLWDDKTMGNTPDDILSPPKLHNSCLLRFVTVVTIRKCADAS